MVYKNQTNYAIVALPNSNQGPALAIVSTEQLAAGFTNLQQAQDYAINFQIQELAPGTTFQLTLTLLPFNLQSKKNTYKFTPDLSSHLYEPLVKTNENPDTTLSTDNADQQLNEALSKIALLNKGTPDFTALHDAQFSSNLDSLDTAVLMKLYCQAYGIPCRLILGKNQTTMYAWVRAFTTDWKDIDVYENKPEKPAEYTVFYEEPKLELRIAPEKEKLEESLYEATTWIKQSDGFGIVIYAIVAIFLALAGYYVFTLAKTKQTPLGLPGQSKNAQTGQEQRTPYATTIGVLDGTYEILKEQVSDPLVADVLSHVKQKTGVVDIDEYAIELKYSKEMVTYAVTFLIEQGFIRKK